MPLAYTCTKEPTHFTTALLQAAVSALPLDTRQSITRGADFCECIQLLENAGFAVHRFYPFAECGVFKENPLRRDKTVVTFFGAD